MDDNALEDALIKSFDEAALRLMLRHRLGLVLEHEVNVKQGERYIVGDLVTLAVRQGWRERLLKAAIAENSGSPWLRALSASSESAQVVADRGALLNAGKMGSGALEKHVRERGILQNWQDFTQKLASLGRCLCRIELPEGEWLGTGFLVGPDIVLTAYHVVEEISLGKAPYTELVCRFDYLTDAGERSTNGSVCALPERWNLGSRRYAGSDTHQGEPEPKDDELDYALIALTRRLGEETVVEGGIRGWIRVKTTPPVVMTDDILVVPQHPDGKPLQLAFGKALTYNSNSTRLRHDANTEQGSSGSPCLTVSLEVCGLHHASGPGRELVYNQCVPMRRIVQDMKDRKDKRISPFWEA